MTRWIFGDEINYALAARINRHMISFLPMTATRILLFADYFYNGCQHEWKSCLGAL